MKKFLLMIPIVTLIFGITACDKKDGSSTSSTLEKIEVVNIINVNDLHGALYEESNHKSMAHLKADIDAIENEDDIKNTIVIGNGDMFQGTALSNLSKGEAVINAMNACNFDVMGLGNHEFDWGLDEVLKYFDGDESNGESTATLVNSNIYHNNELVKNTVPYKIIDLDFVKVGVVSYTPYYLKKSILKTMYDGYDFRDIDVMYDVIKECRKEADVIVANTHWGDGAGDDVNVDLVKAGADAILDGHFHKEYDGLILGRPGSDVRVPVVQSRDQLKDSFGLIKLYIKNHEIIDATVDRIKVGSKGKNQKDPIVDEIINNDYNKYKDVIEEKLCLASGKHYKDNYKTWAPKLIQQNLGVEVGITNKGGIRNVNIKNGQEITYSDIFNIMPFDNKVYIFTLTGEEINSIYLRDAVFACRNGSNDPKYLDYSKEYKVGIIDYVALQNSQLEKMIKDGTAIEHDVILRDMMVNEVREHGNRNIPFNPNNDILLKK